MNPQDLDDIQRRTLDIPPPYNESRVSLMQTDLLAVIGHASAVRSVLQMLLDAVVEADHVGKLGECEQDPCPLCTALSEALIVLDE